LAIKFSVGVRNARLDAVETATGASPILKIRSGAVPANCAAADAGVVLVTMTLPADWMQAASSGTKVLNGLWQDTAADATGTAGHFRIYDGTGTVCHIQGTVSETAGAGDMKLNQATADIVAGQTVTIATFTLTDGNA
jgi:hypothetical protein